MDYFIYAWQHAFDYKGRASRAELLWFVLISLLILLVIGSLERLIFSLPFAEGYFTLFYIILTLCPFATLAVRRLHDLNKSACWLSVFGLAPLLYFILWNKDLGLFRLPLGIYLAVLIYYGIALLLSPSKETENRFGLQPEIIQIDRKQVIQSAYTQCHALITDRWLKIKRFLFPDD